MNNKDTHWQKVGTLFVDAGAIMLGDPCYALTARDDDETTLEGVIDKGPLGWSAFVDEWVARDKDGVAKFDKIAIAVQSGWGDGEYPVYIKRTRHGRVGQVKVVFDIDDDFEEYGW